METNLKLGDKVRIKSIEWYNLNKNGYGEITMNGITFKKEMSKYCGKKLEISSIFDGEFLLRGVDWFWSRWMFEGEFCIGDKDQQILFQIENIQIELDKLRLLITK